MPPVKARHLKVVAEDEFLLAFIDDLTSSDWIWVEQLGFYYMFTNIMIEYGFEVIQRISYPNMLYFIIYC